MLRQPSNTCSRSICSRFNEDKATRLFDAPDKDLQGGGKLHLIRGQIVEILADRLRDQSEEKHRNENIPKIAKGVEQLLFQSAFSDASHCDLSTLDERIRLLLTLAIQRRLKNKTSNMRNRSQVLRKTLGKEKYFYIQNLVGEIRLQKNKKVATLKCCSDNGVCSIPFRKTLPQPVRDLFFDTALLDAFERSPLENVNKVNWDGLVANAEENLLAYHKWAGTN
jgi:hypothetical protein